MYNEFKIKLMFEAYPMINRFATQIDISSASIKYSLVENEAFYRYKLDGDLLFWGDDYLSILDYKDLTNSPNLLIDIYQNDVYIFTSNLDIRSVSINYDNKTIQCKASETEDIYKKVLKNLDKEQSIFIQTPETVYVQKPPKRLQFYTTNVTGSSLFFNYSVYQLFDIDIYARQEIYIFTEAEKNALIEQGWIEFAGILVKDWVDDFRTPILSDFYYILTLTDYSFTANYQYEITDYPDSETGNALSELSDFTAITKFQITNQFSPDYLKFVYFSLKNEDYYLKSETFYTYTTRASYFKYVILLFFKSIDARIDNLYWDFSSFGSVYNDLYLMTLSDFCLSDTNEVKSDAATNSKLSLKKILQYLKDFWKVYWTLSEYDTNKYIITFSHYSDIYTRTTNTAPGNDTTNYKGLNFTEGNNIINYDYTKKYSKITRSTTSVDVDFVGADINFPNIEVDNSLSIDNNTFFSDLNDIYLRKNVYSGDSIEHFVILAVNPSNMNIISGFGAISGAQKLNVDLSLSNLDNIFAADFSDSTVEINNATQTALQSELSKDAEINQFDLPIKNLLSDIKSNEYFVTSHSNTCVLKSLSIKADGTEMAKINLVI